MKRWLLGMAVLMIVSAAGSSTLRAADPRPAPGPTDPVPKPTEPSPGPTDPTPKPQPAPPLPPQPPPG